MPIYSQVTCVCPRCEFVLKNCAAIEDDVDRFIPAEPKKGDISVCPGCRAMLVFEEDLSLRAASYRELEDLCSEFIVGKARRAMALEMESAPSSERIN